jgi:hypothetical protein
MKVTPCVVTIRKSLCRKKVSDKARRRTDTTESDQSQETYGHSNRYEMAHYLWNPKFSVQNSQPVSALSHVNTLNNYQFCLNISFKNILVINALNSRCSSVVDDVPAGAETYYSNTVLVLQHKIGHRVWSEVKAAKTWRLSLIST